MLDLQLVDNWMTQRMLKHLLNVQALVLAAAVEVDH
ncbi:unnamed protein product [Brugia timori]|uniref:Aspartate kinase n=1 Tax=Brugia timori TaxID=42155 RepID=A0A0R3QGI0_9BILA|nr:unnamed protein product [Brugia timori]